MRVEDGIFQFLNLLRNSCLMHSCSFHTIKMSVSFTMSFIFIFIFYLTADLKINILCDVRIVFWDQMWCVHLTEVSQTT
jgi:hypothetical protein